MVELQKEFQLDELRVAMSKGRWNYDLWGRPPVEPSSIGVDIHSKIRAEQYFITVK